MVEFTRLSLARQYLLASFLVMLLAMIVIGTFVARQIETRVIERTAAFTSLYVNSYVTHYLSNLSTTGSLSAEDIRGLDRLIKESPLGESVVSFKVWSPNHRVLYSSNPRLINRWYPENSDLDRSLVGEITSNISDLSDPENEYESSQWDELIEIYAPILVTRDGQIIAVSEFYQVPDALRSEIRQAQIRSWLVIGVTMLVTYLLLASLVGRASNLIRVQHVRLAQNLAQNRQLHAQVQRAAARTTTLNERFLRRISADLHDGLGQDLALALLRLEPLYDGIAYQLSQTEKKQQVTNDFRIVRNALDSALAEVRSIAASLRSPKLENLNIIVVAQHAVRDYERKTGCSVQLTFHQLNRTTVLPWLQVNTSQVIGVPLAVKFTLYRLLQESLANGFRHANGAMQTVRIEKSTKNSTATLSIKIADQGPGFDTQQIGKKGHLGLVGMRERVEVLGGFFQVESNVGLGTTVWAYLPLTNVEEEERD